MRRLRRIVLAPLRRGRSARARPAARLLVVLVLVLAGGAGPWTASLQAQTSLGDFGACIATDLEGRVPGSPGVNTRNFFADPDTLLAAVWVCAGTYTAAETLGIGRAMLRGLLVILIVWTGIGFMFSGRLDFNELLGTILLAGFAGLLMGNFPAAQAALWGATNHGFVALIADQAVSWSDLIIGDADEAFYQAFADATTAAMVNLNATAARTEADPQGITATLQDPGQADAETAGVLVRYIWYRYLNLLAGGVRYMAGVGIWIVGWLVYAQYLWGFFALAVLTILGPLFIPFMLVRQLDFLFWGWFSGLLNGMLYMLTASALYAGVTMLLVSPLQRIEHLNPPDDVGTFWALVQFYGSMTIEYAPLVILSLFAASRVGALSRAIGSGGVPPWAGLGSGLTGTESPLRSAASRDPGGRARTR